MTLPRVAIVGRPNVGKSSLLNMLAKSRVSIVDPTPGITRDRVTAVIELIGPLKTETPRLVEITDTGGYGVYTAEGGRYDDAGEDLAKLTGPIEAQIAAAVERAQMILFVVDAQAGITALDETIAGLLRRRGAGSRNGPAVRVVANKVDADHWEPFAMEAAALGLGEPWVVSAKTKFGRRALVERLFEAVPEVHDADADDEPEMKLALVGRRNAGKSSFVNALAGEERCIVSEIAGTTRDAIDVRFALEGRSMLAIDTAGVRKKSRFHEAVEFYALQRAQASVRRADVCLLLVDATQRIGAIDKRLGRFIADEFRPCVITVTKWDLAKGRPNVKGRPVSPEDYLTYLHKEMPGLSHCPIVFTSSKAGEGLREAVGVAFELFEQSRERLPTAALNDILGAILEERGPTTRLGKQAKILYASQVAVSPPTLVLVVNKPELFGEQYERYLLNRLREATPFKEVPIRLLIRRRKRAELSELKSGEHRARKRLERGEAASARGFGVEGVDTDVVREEIARERKDPPTA